MAHGRCPTLTPVQQEKVGVAGVSQAPQWPAGLRPRDAAAVVVGAEYIQD